MVLKVVVVNPKGGCGKSTIAANLASCYATRGRSAALIDLDTQGSSMRWLKRRPDACPSIYGVAGFRDHPGLTRSFVMRTPPNTERIVVDSAAALSTLDLFHTVRGADKILIPVLPSVIDIHAAASCIADLLTKVKVRRTENRLAVVANRVKRNTIVFRSLMKFLDALDIPIAAVLQDSQVYNRAAESGLGIHELKGGRSVREMMQWESIVEWIDHGTVRSTPLPSNVTSLDPLRYLGRIA